MTPSQHLLHLLAQKRGTYQSGEALARELGVSRAAVWKGIEALRDQGHTIEGIQNRGYRLLSLSTLLDKEQLQTLLSDHEIHLFDSLDSTNRYAKTLASEKPNCKAVVVSTHQSGGRGRLGRTFHSPRGGLYLSVLLPLTFSVQEAPLITSIAAVAVARSIEQVCSLSCSIKWVNDLFLANRKVCGILTEGVLGVESSRVSALVVGIGINVSTPKHAFPLELQDLATSLYESEEAIPDDFDAHLLVVSIVRTLEDLVEKLPDRSFLSEYRERSMVLGKRVTVHQGKERYQALCVAIDDDAHLVVEDEANALHVLSSAEISVRLES
ncbi:MAG: biotin--[acetyl-CoA-carboxylase] ligase [Sphaerochaeta sp.]|nr:biotin--[acetyl-CoA-carboxylase] ligase [Sphaerochaeta sp.]